jgi:hypothetical protein
MGVAKRLGAVLLLLALAGCDQQSDGNAGQGGNASASAGFGAAPSAPSAIDTVTGDVTFRSPSQNIVCALTAGNVRCDIKNRQWQPPPKPADCQLDWGHGMYVDAARHAGFVCAGDTLLGESARTLDYGRSLREGNLLCASQPTGLSCQDTKTNHGFVLAVANFNLY